MATDEPAPQTRITTKVVKDEETPTAVAEALLGLNDADSEIAETGIIEGLNVVLTAIPLEPYRSQRPKAE